MNENTAKTYSMQSLRNERTTVSFTMGGMFFEYDEIKNKKNIEKHGISFKSAARVFFDYDRIEFFDEENSAEEDRYDTIGDLSAGTVGLNHQKGETTIGNISSRSSEREDVIFIVYTERIMVTEQGVETEVTRLISARYATDFERGIYYGKYE